ncbi:MAG: heme exporter protein CcmB [Bacteroidota bacterium]
MPNIFTQVYYLIQKEFLLEWRQKYALGGILLYVFSTVFVVFISSEEINPPVWNTLFWIVVLFASVNAVVKSFVQESGNRTLYYYTLLSPIAVLIAKIIYNLLLLSVVSILTYAAFILFISNPVEQLNQFIIATFLGASGFAIALTFIAAIASKANNSATLMAILGFPVIIPILFTVVRLSEKALQADVVTAATNSIAILGAIDLILLSMAIVLFPFLWRQ